MTEDEFLEKLKLLLEEDDDDARVLSDDKLEFLMVESGFCLARAAYRGALLKARATGVSLPDGVTLESQREYWLTLAKAYRPNCTKLRQRGRIR